ncbi:hypothetical protein DFH08DRAFT_1009336 [Mycena albidolilacea]|uniref:RPN1 N-terminal domain-containing protein n=1 Tax=Mycena albidolilacea TaxID=1033008 RepID=A0AAD7EPB5_9AGAR|nr:hypothetical protein DFH08DRAFT_1009336 [Mycena albidolilacea]
MTSVPKPLKFLRPLYPELQTLYEIWPTSKDKSLFADILSLGLHSLTLVLGGREYVRHLAAELGDEYPFCETEADAPTPTPAPEAGKEEAPAEPKIIGTIEDLHALAKECTVFLIGHNAEPDTVDLLEELEIVDEIAQLVDDNKYNCVWQYMIRLMKQQLAFLLAALQPTDKSKNQLAPLAITSLNTAHTVHPQFGSSE